MGENFEPFGHVGVERVNGRLLLWPYERIDLAVDTDTLLLRDYAFEVSKDVLALTAERDRYREALERIARDPIAQLSGLSPIARTALDGGK